MATLYAMPDDIGNMTSLAQWGNSTLEGFLGILLLFVIFTVMFMVVVRKTEAGNAYATAMFITTIVAIMFKLLDIVDGTTLFICFVLAGLGYLIAGKSKTYY